MSPTLTLDSLLAERARTHGSKAFLRTRAASFTFAGFAEETNRVAHGLAALGVKRGDRVLVLLPNRAEMVVLWFALARLGAIYVPLNAAFKGPALAAMIDAAGSACSSPTRSGSRSFARSTPRCRGSRRWSCSDPARLPARAGSCSTGPTFGPTGPTTRRS